MGKVISFKAAFALFSQMFFNKITKGGVFKSNDMSQVLTEITKSEPSFEINEFLNRVQYDIIPNILESLSQNELEILKDWCTEAVGVF